jgi:hypothetical protein
VATEILQTPGAAIVIEPAVAQNAPADPGVQSQLPQRGLAGQNPLPGGAESASVVPVLFDVTASKTDGAQVSAPAVVPISSQLITLSATPSQLAALVAASSQKSAPPTDAASPEVVSTVKLAGDVRSAVIAAKAASGDVSSKGSSGVLSAGGLPGEKSAAQAEGASSVPSGTVSGDAASGTGVVVVADNGGGSPDPRTGQDSLGTNQGGQGTHSDSRPQAVSKSPEAELQSGTLGANEQPVSKEETNVRNRATSETLPVSLEELPQSSSLKEPADSSVSATGSVFGSAARSSSEVVSKPTVLPPVQVRANEVWRVVQDAVQRARSENPSHLAVEVRMDDGSTLGVELRMSSAGLQASFRSESHSLLRSIEAQWTAFVSKESADARVTSAVFENRSSFGGSTDSGTSGGERRQQMEDALSASSLGRMGGSGQAASGGSASGAVSAGQVQNGRIAAYA